MIICLLAINLGSLFYFTMSTIRGSLSLYIFVLVCSILIMVLVCNYADDFLIDGFNFFVDSTRINLVILRVWIRLLMLLARYKIVRFNEYKNYFILSLFTLMVVLFITFTVGDYIMFYFFFEISLIPTLLIIIGWGYQPERLQAGIYFIFYTIAASLPLLIAINYFWYKLGRLEFFVWINFIIKISGASALILCLTRILAFLVKLPIYFTHLW